MRLGYIVSLFILPTILVAQRIENVNASLVNNKVVITYDVVGATEGQRYKIQLFSSHNNFSSPLFRVTGDVGEITPGVGKRIEWDATSELATFSGEVTFEVRGQLVTLQVRAAESEAFAFRNPIQGSVVRRGKRINVLWIGGVATSSVRLELLHDGMVLQQITETSNTGNYTWSVPKDALKGVGYQLRVSTSEESISSVPFEIKSRFPVWLKVAPVVLLGGIVAIISGGKKSGGNLPAPPDPD